MNNHFADELVPAGGNVSHMDGHAAWYSFDPGNRGAAAGDNTFQHNGGTVGFGPLVPASSLFLPTEGDGSLNDSRKFWIRGARSMGF